MAELWVHPVTEGREASPEWIPLWRFRLIALLVIAVGVLLVIIAYHYASGAADQGTSIPRALNRLAVTARLR